MRAPRIVQVFLGISFATAALGSVYEYAVTPHHSSASPQSAEGIMDRADTLAWGHRWAEAAPLYARAQDLFAKRGNASRALYAEVSRLPANEAIPISAKIRTLTSDLNKPEARDPETQLRILTILGQTETNFDALDARTTWGRVQSLALKLGHVQLSSRAGGEQGIAYYLSGDEQTAKKMVVHAWELAKVEQDPAAVVRYASLYGAGVAQGKHYQQALKPLNEAIKLAAANTSIAYPTIAVDAKIDALAGLHQTGPALLLAGEALKRLDGTLFDGERSAVLISRGEIYRDMGKSDAAINDLQRATVISQRIGNYRGIADAAGVLAQVFEERGDLKSGLSAINMAIEANTHIADELYLVPRNLATKAEITARMGLKTESESSYRKALALVDVLVQHAPNANVQRQLLSESSEVYSGYFASLCDQHRFDEALGTLEKVRGRIEAEALEHQTPPPVHVPTTEDQELTRLNIALINADDPKTRAAITNAIYSTELKISPSALTQAAIDHPVELPDLQRALDPHTVLIEYVLAQPNSYALAVTRDSVTPYRLPSQEQIESDTNTYLKTLQAGHADTSAAQRLFNEVLGPVTEYRTQTDLVVVPDGALHLLPFSALMDQGQYVLQSHTVSVSPSSTVYKLLSERQQPEAEISMPYLGVAAWTQPADTRNVVVRAIEGPRRSQLVPLPESKLEVETIAHDLPQPSTILLGSEATESRFKALAGQDTGAIHLALHGYADLEYPDRSALAFAPESSGSGEDGLLQVREVRRLHLKAKLVTLSACDTGVGPVGEPGVTNLVNAFIEAGADTVVSTLWQLEDHTTEHLMAAFYARLAERKSKVDALRSAQLELLTKGLPPYYWAAFQIVGDSNGKLL